MEGGARRRATGLENRADLTGRGFDSFTFRQTPLKSLANFVA
jgi:hypothetical protein